MKTYGVGKPTAETKIERYLAAHPEGLTSARMAAWIASCTKDDGYTIREYEAALKTLRDSSRIAFACGIWYPRVALKKVEQ